MIISGLGSPSLEDYGLRKWHQIAGVFKCRTPAIYGCQTHVRARRQPHWCGINAACTAADQNLSRYCSWRWLLPTQLAEDTLSQGQGWYPLREKAWRTCGRHIYRHKCRYMLHTLTPSGAEYCHYLSLLSIVWVWMCVSLYLWQFHHPHSQIHSLVARSSLQPGCVSNWHSNWQIWMAPLDG